MLKFIKKNMEEDIVYQSNHKVVELYHLRNCDSDEFEHLVLEEKNKIARNIRWEYFFYHFIVYCILIIVGVAMIGSIVVNCING